jgi:LmbE family N-acetylglucosaminyl deacetylase
MTTGTFVSSRTVFAAPHAVGRSLDAEVTADERRTTAAEPDSSLALDLFAGPVAVFCAHTDDETLGCGGLIQRLHERGVEVHVQWLTFGVPPRPHYADQDLEEIGRRREATRCAALKHLGLVEERTDYLLRQPTCQLDELPMLTVAQAIEEYLRAVRPATVLTHWSGDAALDHRRVTEAVLVAARPKPGHFVRTLLMYETLSNSEWSTGPAFAPNVFVPLTLEHVTRKTRALAAYETELMQWPHPRSVTGIDTLARMRGMQAGVELAEAFQLVRTIGRAG